MQAKYFGPYEIKAKLNDLNYVVHTPGRRREKRVCHINMIKEYFDRQSINNDCTDSNVVHAINDSTDVKVVSTLVHVNDKCTDNNVCTDDNCNAMNTFSVVNHLNDDIVSNSIDNSVDDCVRDVVQSARLKNSDCLSNIDDKLSHLSDHQRTEVTSLISDFEQLFPDVPTKNYSGSSRCHCGQLSTN